MPYFCAMSDAAFLQQLFAGELLFRIPETEPALPETEITPSRTPVQEAVPAAAAAPVSSVVDKTAVTAPAEKAVPVAGTPVAGTPVADISVADISAVVPPTETPDTDALPAAFRHQVLILTDNPSPEELTLLENILKAVQLSLDTVELLDLSKVAGLRYKELLSDKYLHHLLSFGVPLKKVGLQIFLMPYQAREVEGVQFLLVDALKDIQDDKNKKKALWNVLKQLFTR